MQKPVLADFEHVHLLVLVALAAHGVRLIMTGTMFVCYRHSGTSNARTQGRRAAAPTLMTHLQGSARPRTHVPVRARPSFQRQNWTHNSTNTPSTQSCCQEHGLLSQRCLVVSARVSIRSEQRRRQCASCHAQAGAGHSTQRRAHITQQACIAVMLHMHECVRIIECTAWVLVTEILLSGSEFARVCLRR